MSISKSFLFLIFVLSFLLGTFRSQKFLSQIENSKKQLLREKEIEIFGFVDEIPECQEKTCQLVVRLEKEDKKVLVKTLKYPQYKYGDKLKIAGKITEINSSANYYYKNYLLEKKVLAEFDFPKIEKVGEGFGNFLKKILLNFREKFKEKVEEFLPSPQVWILEALIFGQDTKISKEWKEKLNLTGTRHIVAASGMNITILFQLVLNFALAFSLWRQQAIFLSLFLIFLYVLMIGAPSSAVRAAIMGCLALIAQLFGRYSFGTRPLLFAATAMIFQNPLILIADVGFQLSFLAVLGLIFWKDFFQNLFKKIPNPKIYPLRDTLATTFSAQIFTFPLLLYNFGNFSLLSPLTNLIIVPLLPHLTVLFLFFGILAMISWPIGWVFSLPVYLILTLLCQSIDFFSKLYPSRFSFKISVFWLLFFYSILAIFTWQWRERQRLKFLG